MEYRPLPVNGSNKQKTSQTTDNADQENNSKGKAGKAAGKAERESVSKGKTGKAAGKSEKNDWHAGTDNSQTEDWHAGTGNRHTGNIGKKDWSWWLWTETDIHERFNALYDLNIQAITDRKEVAKVCLECENITSWNTMNKKQNDNKLFWTPDSTDEREIMYGNGIKANTTHEELILNLNVSNRARLLKIELFLPRFFQYLKE